ncbi:hypothetical protein [Lewinella sp. W8]|uniref:hypothetical protein n=1 Tax=Lewinella sp. W8 TaxID=2528208 RepID=UPI001067A318|nr:hypothetical protein [Lewinella sp. W8]MTB51414.1 hypothetical protein [Lewinella sp. W8]
MHLLGLTSRYALLGLLLTVLTALVLSGPPSPQPQTSVKFREPFPAASADFLPPDIDFKAFEESLNISSEEFYFEPAFGNTPDLNNSCFDVSYAPELLQGMSANKPLFTGQTVEAQELMFKDIESYLLKQLHEEIIRGTEECMEGSIIISLQIDEEGAMGPTMLAHNLTGGTDYAGLAIMAYFSELRLEGHQWENTTGEPMEVRLPLRFKLVSK